MGTASFRQQSNPHPPHSQWRILISDRTARGRQRHRHQSLWVFSALALSLVDMCALSHGVRSDALCCIMSLIVQLSDYELPASVGSATVTSLAVSAKNRYAPSTGLCCEGGGFPPPCHPSCPQLPDNRFATDRFCTAPAVPTDCFALVTLGSPGTGIC